VSVSRPFGHLYLSGGGLPHLRSRALDAAVSCHAWQPCHGRLEMPHGESLAPHRAGDTGPAQIAHHDCSCDLCMRAKSGQDLCHGTVLLATGGTVAL
jgi:hypothetical protein